MARRSKPKVSEEERAALQDAAAKADKVFSRRFSSEPKIKPSAEPAAGESIAEVVVEKGGLSEVRALYPNGAAALHVELYAKRADRVSDAWRPGDFLDGKLRFTPLTICGASNGWSKDEASRVARCQVINADLAAPWAVRLKVREA